MRRSVSSLLVLLIALASLASAEKAPNVIFILLDDMGWGDFGVLHQNRSKHSRRHQTPMLDEMAAQGDTAAGSLLSCPGVCAKSIVFVDRCSPGTRCCAQQPV